jgi:hypothetical protein
MNNQKITDRIMDILEIVKASYKGTDTPPLAQYVTEYHEICYLLGRLPADDQRSLIGLLVATQGITIALADTWLRYLSESEGIPREELMQNMPIKRGPLVQETAERVHVFNALNRLALTKSDQGECPPEDLRNECPHPQVSCHECWIRTLIEFISGHVKEEHEPPSGH